MILSELANNIEDKVTYTTQAGGIDYNGSVFNLLSALTRADGSVDAFTGNLIRPKMISVYGEVSTNQTHTAMRLVLFQLADASSPAPSGIFEQTANALAPFSAIYWTNVHKIHVLADDLITLFPVAGSYAVKGFRFVIKSGLRTVQFPTSSTSIPQMNGIYLAAISDDGLASYPQLNFISEVRFSDA